jgi:long-chain acyl-CoA synthetase
MADLALAAADAYGDRAALRVKRGDAWSDISYGALGATVRGIGAGLASRVQPGARVGVLGATSADWTAVDFAIAAAGAISVPVYATNAPEECEWVLGNSGAVAVVCEDADQLAKIAAVRDRLPALQTVVVMKASDASSDAGSALDAITLEELQAEGRAADEADGGVELDRRRAGVQPEDPFTIVYTSGTTGPPKGCVLTHANLRFVCDVAVETQVIRGDDVVYLFLPLAHVFARVVEIASVVLGATVAYSTDAKQIVAELAEIHPTYLPSVPRIFEKLYTMATAFELSGDQVKGIFGGAIRQATSGAAPIAPEILEFFFAAGIPVLEGFGMSETAAVATLSTVEHHKFGTVGRALPGVDIRIADDGEIVLRGPNVFQGYWDNPAATAEILQDGWLHTGDIGEIDGDGYLKITGRKKDIIITAGGKNLAPANLENDLKQSRWISQAIMYGDRRPYPVALITLDEEEIASFAREHDLPADIPALAEHPQVRLLIQGVLDDVNKRYAPVEQIKRFHILDHDFSQEAGELTPTLKLKRNVVNEQYADVFDALYAGEGG